MEINQILVKYWGYSSFRPLQEDIIRSVMAGKDTLALLPTGGGKSICYQVPALAMDGICIVISPLIALMKDQVERLKKTGIKAFAIYSGMHPGEIELALNNVTWGDAKFLYISPERLATPYFRESLKQMKVNLLAVDEAHCISQWGYDFRPPYLKIAEVRQFISGTPILAVTASATPNVVDDIQKKLEFRSQNVIRQSFERKNLTYVVREKEDKKSQLVEMLKKLNGSAIVYTRSRRRTYDVARFLVKNGISAEHYHAGLDSILRDQRQKSWMAGQTRVIVATNAFGLGIDKPDVRLVVHLDLTDSIEAYFQEAGRAGRDGKRAYAVILFHSTDIDDAMKQFEDSYPEMSVIKSVYQALGNFLKLALGSGKNMSFDFDLADFSNQYNFNPVVAYNSLKFLEKEGYLILSEGVHFPARIHVRLQGEDVYRFQVEHPDVENFAKLILRTYTGLFSQYVKISENELAQKTNLKVDDIYRLFLKLDKLGFLDYIPQRNKPQIILTEERIDSKDIYISKENYEFRKKTAMERLKSMHAYISSANRCRSIFLLSYFGETGLKRCGYCDICIERNKINLSELEFDLVLEQIKPILKKLPHALNELLNNLPGINRDKALRVLDWLIDNDKVVFDADQKLSWKSK